MDKLNKKTKAIAELEQRIHFLSYDVVPSSFISTHAIKLRNQMFANLHLNSDNAYIVGADKSDKVFGPEESFTIPEVNIPESNGVPFEPEAMAAAVDTSDLEKNVSDINTQSIRDSIEREAAKIENVDNSTVVPPEEVAKVVTGVTPITRDEIETTIQSKADQIPPVVSDTSDYKEPTNIVENVSSTENDYRVNQNGSSAARINHFDDNGESLEKSWIEEDKIQNYDIPKDVTIPIVNEPVSEPVPLPMENVEDSIQPVDDVDNSIYPVEDHSEAQEEVEQPVRQEWVPLTDDQIEVFRKDLAERPIVSAEKTDSIMQEDTPDPEVVLTNSDENKPTNEAVRDFVVVAPDREVLPSNEKKEVTSDVVIENSMNTSKDFMQEKSVPTISFEHVTSIEELERIKERIQELQIRQNDTKKAMDEAERMDQNTTERVEEILRAKEESDKAREESMKKLIDYSDALEEDCNYNENRRRIALENVERNKKIIQTQEESIRSNDEMIDAMMSLMGEEATNLSVRRR